MIEDVGKYNCECHWIKYDATNRKSALVTAFFKLYSLFGKIKPDVVNCHLFDDALPSLLAARFRGIKIRANTRGDTGYHYYYIPKWFVFDKFNNRNSTHIIAISEECKDFVLDIEKGDPSKVTRIHHGIPVAPSTNSTEEYRNFLKDKYNLHGKKLIGTVSRFIDWKGYKYIINAAKEVVKDFPDAVFCFVGYGEQEEELLSMIKEYGIEDNVKIIGWVDHHMMPSFYSILDIYLHAAYKEPFGFVIAEALMNGVPVVSTKTGAAADAIEHLENGYLTEYKDAKSIEEGVRYMLKNDTELIRKKAAKTGLELYDFERMWDDYIELYLKTLNN